MEHYQIVQLQNDQWSIFDNWATKWIPADFNSRGAALAFVQLQHPNAEIIVKEPQ